MTRPRVDVGKRASAWLPIAVMAIIALAALLFGRADLDNTIAARAERVASGIRCAVCQGLSVAQSKESSARAIYEEIVRRVEAGETDATIRGYIAGRYGEQMLLRPSANGAGSIVWLAPVGLGVLALVGLGVAFRRWRPRPGGAADSTDEALVARERRRVGHQVGGGEDHQ